MPIKTAISRILKKESMAFCWLYWYALNEIAASSIVAPA